MRLAILFAIAIAALILARQRFIPEDFGEQGHFRTAAIEANANRDLHYAGRETCIQCHDEQGHVLSSSYHRTLACEVCHGPAYNHVNDPDTHKPAIPRRRGTACLYCHEYLPSRPTGFPQIIERTHNPMEACISCHDPHDPTPPETPESCSACHAQIARTKAVSHHNTLECVTCHQVDDLHRQNPRAARPTKPSGREFCGRCHATDAASPPAIPRIDLDSHGRTYLCWQCHYPHHPES